jgi:hypothetical protein
MFLRAVRLLRGAALAKSHITPTMFALSPIEHPRCHRCQDRMVLVAISLGPQGRDFRTFECAKSDQSETIIAYDPMKSEKAGRLEGELKPPTPDFWLFYHQKTNRALDRCVWGAPLGRGRHFLGKQRPLIKRYAWRVVVGWRPIRPTVLDDRSSNDDRN